MWEFWMHAGRGEEARLIHPFVFSPFFDYEALKCFVKNVYVILCYMTWYFAKQFIHTHTTLLLGHWYEIMALYYVKSILTEISASRQDRRVLQKSKIIRIDFLSKWGMLQTSRYV